MIPLSPAVDFHPIDRYLGMREPRLEGDDYYSLIGWKNRQFSAEKKTFCLTPFVSRRVHGCHQAAVADRSRPVRGLPVETRHQAAHEIQEGVPDVQRRYPGRTSHKHTENPRETEK